SGASTSSRKSFRGRSGRRLGRGVSRPLSSRFMKGDGIPLTPASGALLPRKDSYGGLLTIEQLQERRFIEHRDAQLLGLLELGARLRPRHHVVRFLGNAGAHLGAE